MPPVLTPLARAIGQFDDRAFLGVIGLSLLWSALCFALLHVGAVALVHAFLGPEEPLGWLAGWLASVGATVLSIWLFVPTAAAIATLYADRVARAVDRRYYPHLPPAQGASVGEQVADAIGLALRLLALALLGLLLLLFIPGIGLICAWVITGYALGRGLFITVAMRRMGRLDATRLYRGNRGTVLAQGLIIAVSVWLPVVNLFVPVLAVAMMVHVLDRIMTRRAEPNRVFR